VSEPTEPNEPSHLTQFSVRWRNDDGREWYDHPTSLARAAHRRDDKRALGVGELVRREVTTTAWWAVHKHFGRTAGPPSTAYGIGCDIDGTSLHAVDPRVVDSAFGQFVDVPAECGRSVRIAQQWGAFRRGNEKVDQLGACVRCAWSFAVATGATQQELVALNPSSAAEHDALVRLLPNALLYLDICRKLVADLEDGGPDGRFVQLLTVATEHRPVVLLDGMCSEDNCDHDEKPQDCYADADTVACGACTVSAGAWAGEFAGYTEMLVSAEECPVLPAMAEALGMAVAS
jgi:hypothetical protein